MTTLPLLIVGSAFRGNRSICIGQMYDSVRLTPLVSDVFAGDICPLDSAFACSLSTAFCAVYPDLPLLESSTKL